MLRPAFDVVIVHFEIPVDDVDRAKRFYGELFGWTFQERSALPGEGPRYVLIETGGRPNGALMARPGSAAGVLNYFGVENLDEHLRRAESLGAEILAPKSPVPAIGWWAVLQDPEGNVFALFQDDRAAAGREKLEVGSHGGEGCVP